MSGILTDLTTLGVTPTSLSDLHDMINGLEDKEELHAWIVAEGVAVSTVSGHLVSLHLKPRGPDPSSILPMLTAPAHADQGSEAQGCVG